MGKVTYIFFLLSLLLSIGAYNALEVNSKIIDQILKNHNQNIKSRDVTPRDVLDFLNMTTPESIIAQGYVCEIHHVTTEDGYILEMHRIPYGKDGPSAQPRPVAYLEHGILSSSFDWVADTPDRALGYLLADYGYDVWMNNKRGNTYSRGHVIYDADVDKKEYWEFTWDEMGVYDVPAAIDYVLSTTNNTQLYYIGYSMGTTVFFVMMNERPEYADKIKVAALLAPVAYFQNIEGAMKALANYSDDLDTILSLLGYYEFLPSSNVSDYIASHFCLEEDITSPICYNVLFALGGYDPEELNRENVPVYISHTPAGTSTHTINHYGQLYNVDVFQWYDWGPIGNQQHYGQDTPPVYDLTIPTPPIALFWGQNDYLAAPADVARLAGDLQNLVLNHRVEWDSWAHLDFMWGIHAKEYCFDYVITFLAGY